jgi:hypothetical protein
MLGMFGRSILDNTGGPFVAASQPPQTPGGRRKVD